MEIKPNGEQESLSPIEDWLDAGPGQGDAEALETWLAEDPEVRMRQLVEASAREQMLREAIHAQCTAREVLRISDREEKRERITRFPGLRRAAVAAMAAGIVVTLIALFFQEAPQDDFAAAGELPGEAVLADVLRSTDGAVVTSDYRQSTDEGEATPGRDQLLLGRFRLESGSVALALPSDVRIELFGPLEAEFDGAMRLQLFEGRLNAEVGPAGKGFTVVTEAGEVIDLGTRFGVEADRDGEARVAVFSGTVEFHPANAKSGEFVTLTEGESLRFSVVAGLRRWQQVALAAEEAGLADRPNSGVLRLVSDNQGERDEDGREIAPYYGVVSGGMRDGALAFTDKPGPHYRPFPGESFPEALIGADLVRTYYSFRHKKQYELTLTLAEPAEVFLLMLSPHDVPSWVEEQGFERTGERLLAGPWHFSMRNHPGALMIDDDAYLTFVVWKARVDAGEFVLGPPLVSKNGLPVSNYGVAVKPLTP